MRRGSVGAHIGRLWPYAVAATLAVVVLPVIVVLTLITRGLPEPQIVLSTVLGVALSCGGAAAGASLWLRRPESVDVAFGELMLWRFLRRKKAEDVLVRGAKTLDLDALGDEDRVITLAPDQRLEVLRTLAAALEAKDPYTHGHSRRVERHVYRTAMAMHIPVEKIEELRLAAALHDVGKVGIPDRILRKPGSLDIREMEMVREHCITGAAMVAEAAVPQVTEAIRHHHECFNGSGYPDGLAGEEIPQFARIIAVADAYDAITSARPYRAGSSRRDAIEALRSGAGVQFDPEIVEAFISTLPTAIPAAGALLIFAPGAQAVRKISAWAKGAAGGSVATATGAAGVAVMVGAASIVGGGIPRRMPESVVAEAREATRNAQPIVLAASETRGRLARAEALAQRAAPKDETVERAEKKRSATNKKKDKGRVRKASLAATAEGSSPQATSARGKSATAGSNGHNPPGDPQPDRGRDCEPKKGRGKGHDIHCG